MTPPRRGNGPGHGGPASGIPARGTRRFEPGHTASRTHGAHSRAATSLAVEVLDQVDAMVAGTPAESPLFAAARQILARKIAQLQLVTEWLDSEDRGPLDDGGEVRSAAAFQLQLMTSIERSFSELGLTPLAAARLGAAIGARPKPSAVMEMQRAAIEQSTGGEGAA